MQARIFIFMAIAVTGIVSCSSDKPTGGGGMPNTIVEPEKYFPIGQGDTWYYFLPNSGSHILRTISGDTMIYTNNFNDSALCARVLHNGATSEAWTVDSTGFRLHLDDGILRFESPLLIPFNLVRDVPFSYDDTARWSEGGNQYWDVIRGHLSFKGYVTDSVPAGKFVNAIKARLGQIDIIGQFEVAVQFCGIFDHFI